jgi:hypothetical protein
MKLIPIFLQVGMVTSLALLGKLFLCLCVCMCFCWVTLSESFEQAESCHFYLLRRCGLLYLILHKRKPLWHHVGPFQILVHIVSEFSSLATLPGPSRTLFAHLYYLVPYANRSETAFESENEETPNSYAACHWLLASLRALIAIWILFLVHEDCVFLTCFIIWT